jgi:hypothetical protein
VNIGQKTAQYRKLAGLSSKNGVFYLFCHIIEKRTELYWSQMCNPASFVKEAQNQNSESTMSKFAFLLLSSFAFFATAATAQQAVVATEENDCEDEANKDDEACIVLPGADDVQNFIPGIVPLIGGGGILAAGLSSNGTTSTTTTTTSTN